MRPHPALTGTMILTFIVGLLLALSFLSQEDGTGNHRQHAILTAIITGILLLFMVILATSKLWFPHLWKKNSTHARHKQHTRHHPVNRQHPPRQRR